MSTPQGTTQSIRFTRRRSEDYRLTRRELLSMGLGLSGSLLVGSGFVASGSAAWAMEVKAITPESMATLVQMARDIYPHDRFGDELYALALKGHDEKAASDASFKSMLEEGVSSLDRSAQAMGHSGYVATGWESERVDILNSIQDSEFFQTIRGGLVVGLYNQKPVWELLGYEGASFDKGGYLDRGFDDVTWL